MKILLVVLSSMALLAGCSSMPGYGSGGGQTSPAAKTAAEPTMDDATVTSQVKAALAADPELAQQKINVLAKQGAVQLKGEIKTITLRRKAEDLVKGVKGVKSVDNQLIITG